jgi:CMP-N-acetylneuraminic acid synthetase
MAEIVGLVPARGGSKAIPRKNLAEVAGKPLLAWSIEAAQQSERLTRTVVSTDSPDVAEVARAYGAEVLDRPPELAEDETPMLDVVLHALGHLGACDVLVLLQPTSPLRRAAHVDATVDLLLETGADSVVSVVEVPHAYRPESLLELRDGRVVELQPGAPKDRRQKAVLYARNGPAVLALRPNRLDRERGLYGGDCRAFVMDERDSLDVDEPWHLELADLVLRRR